MKLLSVIVPAYNSMQWIKECLHSIQSQTYSNLEIIVIDDGSTDGTSAIVKSIADKDKRLHLHKQENQGVSAARNKGLELATGEYIAFVDSDDLIHSQMYEILVRALEINGADIMACGATRSKQFSCQDMKVNILDGRQALYDCFQNDSWLCLWDKVYRKEVIASLRFPEGRKFEDAAVGHIYIGNCSKVGYIRDKLYYYRKNASSICQTSFVDKDRYDYFLAIKERYLAGRVIFPELENKLKADLIKAALSVLTSVYANDSNYKENIYFRELYKMITAWKEENVIVDTLSLKYRLLYFTQGSLDLVHLLYAKLSKVFKHQLRTKLFEGGKSKER